MSQRSKTQKREQDGRKEAKGKKTARAPKERSRKRVRKSLNDNRNYFSGPLDVNRAQRRALTIQSASGTNAAPVTAAISAGETHICMPTLPALIKKLSRVFAEISIKVLNCFFMPTGQQPPWI